MKDETKIDFEQLNLNGIEVPYKTYKGISLITIPQIINEGRKVLTIKNIIEQRIKSSFYQAESIQKNWWNNPFRTGSGIIEQSENKIKLVSDLASKINFNNVKIGIDYHRYNSVILLNKKECDEIQGIELSSEELKEMRSKYYSREESSKHPVWKHLVDNDEEILKTYFGLVDAYCEYEKDRIGISIHMGQDKPEYILDLKNFKEVVNYQSHKYKKYPEKENLAFASFLTISGASYHSEISRGVGSTNRNYSIGFLENKRG